MDLCKDAARCLRTLSSERNFGIRRCADGTRRHLYGTKTPTKKSATPAESRNPSCYNGKNGADEPIRTVDLLITSELLYQLSYVGLARRRSRAVGESSSHFAEGASAVVFGLAGCRCPLGRVRGRDNPVDPMGALRTRDRVPAMSATTRIATDQRRIWVDGKLVPWADASVHILSHSIQRGALVFDYMSVRETARGAAVFRMGEHLERFANSCELVGLPLVRNADELGAAIRETVRANPGARSVKISAYFASLEVDVVPVDTRVTVAIAAYDPKADLIDHLPTKPPPPPRVLKIWIEKERRNRRPDIVPPQAKVSANYVSSMIAKWRARDAGYDEILLVDAEGNLAEGPTTNVFLVDADGVLRTPPEERVLLGVTRLSILELARDEGLAVEEVAIRPEELFTASEVFVTGTTAGVWPVGSVDGERVGTGELGPVSARLRERFVAATRGDDPAFASWLTYVDEQ
jgi:branched-chain amino acid aminotransferase